MDPCRPSRPASRAPSARWARSRPQRRHHPPRRQAGERDPGRHEGDPDSPRSSTSASPSWSKTPRGSAEQLTMVGQRFGTPTYMSPSSARQADRRAQRISTPCRSCSTRCWPDGPVPDATMTMPGSGDARRAGAAVAGRGCIRVGFPLEVEDLVFRGLAKEPGQRYRARSSTSRRSTSVRGSSRALHPGRTRGSAKRGASQRFRRAASRALRALRSRRSIAALTVVVLLVVAGIALYRASRPDHAAHARALLADGRPDEAMAYLQDTERTSPMTPARSSSSDTPTRPRGATTTPRRLRARAFAGGIARRRPRDAHEPHAHAGR